MKASRLLLAAALAAAPAFAQQNVDVSGKDFESGAGDARLATVGREAAASGKRIVVTAPQQWHSKIAAKIRAGGAADVVLKDGFYENVLVRVEDKPAEAPKPEPKAEAQKAEARAEAKAAPKVAAQRVPVEVPGPKPTLPPPAAPEPAPVAAPPPVQEVAVAKPPPAAPAAATVPAAPPAAAPATTVASRAPAMSAPAKPDVAKIQKRLEESLNNGREAEGPIQTSGLEAGDFIFVDGPVRAVVRRESLRPRMFWLEGDLDLRRSELKELGTNRYQVINPISGASYALREDRAENKDLVAAVPAANSPVRATFERDYNDGHSIDDSIAVEKLRSGDLVYVGKGMAVVVRREGTKLARFWLDGTLDLGQPGLQKDGTNKYKVISDTLR
ncbi:MAG TPA: hypothetical protein VH375_04680 [Rhodanobacteraceae bacterium]